eukprot:m.349183 g.349183  ORF g.349183 m.349183 type:complete len:72 (+) comp16569_c0_seq1:476-691(+)
MSGSYQTSESTSETLRHETQTGIAFPDDLEELEHLLTSSTPYGPRHVPSVRQPETWYTRLYSVGFASPAPG